MNFESGYLYHIYNQGNNRVKIFYSQENYLFFLEKIKKHFTPFVDILAWCLMPNHFHLLVYIYDTKNSSDLQTEKSKSFNSNNSEPSASFSLNQSIGIMLRSYTRAINLQQNRSGSLFREATKAICLNANSQLAKSWYLNQGVTMINHVESEKQYPNICYNYILFNPVKDGLVKHSEDWEFSSYRDVIGLRNGKLINRERINSFALEVNPELMGYAF
ncbi:MAG: hypothetical protein EA361_02065 [Bacteroidetes bacterium]|nr:MAG: hypothetical protein EA361_02065 [Bacteroidota bacterium]